MSGMERTVTEDRCPTCGTISIKFDPPLVFDVSEACGALKPGEYEPGAELPLCEMPRDHKADHMRLVEEVESWSRDE